MHQSRTGNALVLAVGLLAVVAAVMVTTTESAVNSVVRSKQRVDHQVISAAVNATLFRRESMLNQAALLGAEGFPRRFDPAYDYDMATVGFVGSDNYGIDYIGDVEVRWRIEPVQAREGGVWKQNPRPDGESPDLELPNTFLFRIAAEGRTYDGRGDAEARVQGVRYSAIAKEPLFRYIIFYSQEGAKGDIEFAHGPAFSARGNVHTNGAIYLGEAAVTASWDSLKSGLVGSTQLGPYQDPYTGAVSPALVNAYDGIYRLSKRVMFNRANLFPIAGSNPSFVSAWYDLSAGVPYPGESGASVHYRSPPGGSTSILQATHGGREINPQRVLDGVGMVTTETDDSKRTINGNPVRGVTQGSAKANDSRDRHRPAGELVWSQDSLRSAPDGFDRKARSSDNGGRIVRLPEIMRNRAFEAQRLRYDDVDGDPTTDDHDYARPVFLVGGAESLDHPATGPVVEAPGSYLSYALGSNEFAFTRVSRTSLGSDTNIAAGYNAWIVTAKDGAASGTDPQAMGLIIRERMVPDLNYLSGSAASSASPDYMPYAYGKHVRSTKWPMWPVDVSARAGSDTMSGRRENNGFFRHAYTTTDSSQGSIDSTRSRQDYADGGILSVAAAADETAVGATGFGSFTDAISGITRLPRYFRSSWRLFHLQRPVADTTQQGLVGIFHIDWDATRPWLPSGGWLGPLSGPVVHRALFNNGVNHTDFSGIYTFPAAVAPKGQDYFSVRWTGFVSPPVSGAYRFYHSTDDGGRLWVNDIRLADSWTTQGGSTPNGGGEASSVTLEKDRWYPIVVEMFDKDGGQKSILEWEAPGLARQVVPGNRMAPPAGTNAGAIPRSQWSAVQAKVVPGAIPAAGKAGLMVQPLPPRVPTVPATIYQWTTQTVGGVTCAQVQPNPSTGTSPQVRSTGNGAAALNGPRMTYSLTFPTVAGLAYPRSFRVWLRAYQPGGASGANDSTHIRFNGTTISQAGFGFTGFSGNDSWQWISNVNSAAPLITVPGPGTYTLEVYMREAGVAIDRILVSSDTGPSGVAANGLASAKQTLAAGVYTQVTPTAEATIVLEAEGALPANQVLPVSGAVDDTGRVLHTPAVVGLPSGLPALIDGQEPSLVLAYSPTRGVFAEFRGERAVSDGRTPNRLFTGTSTATDANGEQGVGPAGAERQATLTPTQGTTNADGGTIVERRRDGGKNDDGTVKPTTQNDLTVSEGKYDNVWRGAWSRYQYRRPQIDLQRTVSTTWSFVLGNRSLPGTQVFDPTNDEDKNLAFYSTTTGADQTGLSPSGFSMNTSNGANPQISGWDGNQFNATWRSSTDPDWQDWGDTSAVAAPTSPVSSVVVGDTTFSNVPVTQTIAGSEVTRTWTFGDADTYWYRDNDPPKYDGTSTTVPFANFKANIQALNSAYKVVRITDKPPAPAAFVVPYQPDPATNYLTAPSAPTAWQNGTAVLTFGLDRTGTVVFDRNPFVTAWGTWWTGAAQRPLVLPWNATLWNAIVPPTTGGFRPDLWNHDWAGTTAPGNSPRRAGITSLSSSPDTVTDAGGTMVGSTRWTSDQPSAWPPVGGLPSAVWLRIERSSGDLVTLKYKLGPAAPAPSDWLPVLGINGAAAQWSIADWTPDLLLGPALQSGSKTTAIEATFSDISVEFSAAQITPAVAAVAAPADRLNSLDWEAADATGIVDSEKYLAGQYQVFFGPYEITEDFLTWKTASGARIANESWIYQPREFWSQSRWWNTYQGGTPALSDEKDPANILPTTLTPTVRELISKSTILTIDLAAFQEYLATRGLDQAVADRIAGAGPVTPPTVAADGLASRFNGLFYMARSNRYPWNPNIQGANPYNIALPNVTNAPASLTNDDLIDLTPADRATAYSAIVSSMATANQSRLHGTGVTASLRNALQPYTALIGDHAPAFRSTEFHHGVRIVNGQSINWGFSGGGTPPFGTGKTAIVTPNLLYVQGDLNTVRQNVIKNGSATTAYVPLAIMGDQVNFLSGAWNDSQWRTPGITADANGLTSTCLNAQSSLARGYGSLSLPAANNMSVVAAVVTHNQPTTRDSVRIGEAASIISTMLFMENWAGRSFDYTGSLVVMDSRRYTASFQLDGSKGFGPSPFGFMDQAWRIHHGLDNADVRWGTTSAGVQIPGVYTAPDRTFTFNPDLLTPQGTPPFAPFGTSARGVGGWVRIVQ